MRILSIDPGGAPPNGTTGIALVSVSGEWITVERTWAVEGGHHGFCKWVREELYKVQPLIDYVVCEQFVKYKNVADTSPLLIEGVVRYLWPKAVLQPASGKNKTVPDSILKKYGWYNDNSHHHDVREAIRHAIFWLKKQGLPAALKL